jgi:hypothetical protein
MTFTYENDLNKVSIITTTETAILNYHYLK